jgi:hypothetical protein
LPAGERGGVLLAHAGVLAYAGPGGRHFHSCDVPF